MTRFRGIRGLIGKRPDRERSEKRRREWKEERVSNLFSFLKVAEEGGGGAGSHPQMTFYECKFLIKLKVGLQIRNEAKFSSFVGAVSLPPP